MLLMSVVWMRRLSDLVSRMCLAIRPEVVVSIMHLSIQLVRTIYQVGQSGVLAHLGHAAIALRSNIGMLMDKWWVRWCRNYSFGDGLGRHFGSQGRGTIERGWWSWKRVNQNTMFQHRHSALSRDGDDRSIIHQYMYASTLLLGISSKTCRISLFAV